ncbi:MAG TPA: glycine betaine ABC transporter substrate-binding protein [Nocardioidaceae bacterium]|nr:glycine betaine ABC transporter substrate-binding protein [Nocardioidaceae bacterium]
MRSRSEPSLVEAGRGIGMSNLGVMFRIELPLAVPVIMTGIRTALVLLVGTATLATFINAGRGLHHRRPDQGAGPRVLEDDRNFFPAYNVSVVIREEVLDVHPQIEELFAPVTEKLDDETLIELNAQIDVEGRRAGRRRLRVAPVRGLHRVAPAPRGCSAALGSPA